MGFGIGRKEEVLVLELELEGVMDLWRGREGGIGGGLVCGVRGLDGMEWIELDGRRGEEG